MKNATTQPSSNLGYIRLSKVLELTAVSKSSIWHWSKKGKFPPPIKIGANTTVWRKSEVLDFIEHGKYIQPKSNSNLDLTDEELIRVDSENCGLNPHPLLIGETND